MKKYLLPAAATTAFIAGLSVVSNTIATTADCTADAETNITTLLGQDCPIIKVSTDQTETITLNKPVTIQGTGGKLIGTITINTGATDVTLENLTINSTSSGAELVAIKAKTNLTVKNSQLYTGASLESPATFTQGNTAGIVSYGTGDGNGSGSVINIDNSKISAKYAVWLESGNNTLNIVNGSQLSGYAALDLTSSNVETTAPGNHVTISGSTLTGIAAPTGLTNDYGTIVVGNQDGTSIDIDNSTITNSFSGSNARQDLILIQSTDGDTTATNTTIDIVNSELKNTATDPSQGTIYNNNGSEANNFVATDSVLTGPAFADQYSVTFHVDGVTTVISVDEGGIINPTDIPAAVKAGYEFVGWFTDPEFNIPFDISVPVSADTNVYAKFVAIAADETNPDTSDSIALYATIATVALLGLGATVLIAKKARH